MTKTKPMVGHIAALVALVSLGRLECYPAFSTVLLFEKSRRRTASAPRPLLSGHRFSCIRLFVERSRRNIVILGAGGAAENDRSIEIEKVNGEYQESNDSVQEDGDAVFDPSTSKARADALQQALRQMSAKSANLFKPKQPERSSATPFLTQESFEQLTAMADGIISNAGPEGVKKFLNDLKGIQSDLFSNQEDDGMFGGVFLSEDDYLNAQQYMRPDGSIQFLQQQEQPLAQEFRHSVPESLIRIPEFAPLNDVDTSSSDFGYYSYDGHEPTMEDLIEASQRQIDPETQSRMAEEIHRRVFENEEAFNEQSELFRQSLVNETASREAAALRRSEKFRMEQDASIKRLDKKIEEFEAVLKQRRAANSVKVCVKCNRRLAKDAKVFSLISKKYPDKKGICCEPCYNQLMDKRKKSTGPPPT